MKVLKLLAATVLVAAATANAQMSPDMVMPKPASAVSAGTVALTDGVVQEIDKAGGTVTLKHGEIANMGMPAMTMAFGVARKKMLDGIKTGDKVRFHLENVKGAPTVTRLETTQ